MWTRVIQTSTDQGPRSHTEIQGIWCISPSSPLLAPRVHPWGVCTTYGPPVYGVRREIPLHSTSPPRLSPHPHCPLTLTPHFRGPLCMQQGRLRDIQPSSPLSTSHPPGAGIVSCVFMSSGDYISIAGSGGVGRNNGDLGRLPCLLFCAWSQQFI